MKIRIIGIDPGTYCTGYSILEFNNLNKLNRKIFFISSGCIKSNSKIFSLRLNKIYRSILNILFIFKPFVLAIEKTFLFNNLNSSFKLNQVNAVITLAAVRNFIPIYEYNINKIKNSIFKRTNINKKYINLFFKDFFNINKDIDLNITDSIAVAMCHIFLNY